MNVGCSYLALGKGYNAHGSVVLFFTCSQSAACSQAFKLGYNTLPLYSGVFGITSSAKMYSYNYL